MIERPAGEFGLIRWIRGRRPVLGPQQGVVGDIGDDCATVRFGESSAIVTTDMLMDGRHFVLDRDGPAAVGIKAMGANLSDIAAMCGTPRYAVVAVALPRHDAAAIGKGVDVGLRRMANDFGVAIIGGDTNAWDGPLVVCVTLMGDPHPMGSPSRAGARVGDAIFVTGPLGGSLHRGRHLNPAPRIREAQAIRPILNPTAMIDLSDGLSSDLGHILDESGGLGAVLDEDAIPIHPDAVAAAARDGLPPLLHALHDGEDFELCLTANPRDADKVVEGVTLHRVGLIVAEPGLRLRSADGRPTPVERRGFDHFLPFSQNPDDRSR